MKYLVKVSFGAVKICVISVMMALNLRWIAQLRRARRTWFKHRADMNKPH